MGIETRNFAFILAGSLFLVVSNAQNKVLGELQLEGTSKIEKTSGVWIDGQYLLLPHGILRPNSEWQRERSPVYASGLNYR